MSWPERHVSRDGRVDVLNKVTGATRFVGWADRWGHHWRAVVEGGATVAANLPTRASAVDALMLHIYGEDDRG